MLDENINELHWLMGILHTINIGLVVVDMDYRVKVWNQFMENRSGIPSGQVMGKNLFNLCSEIPEEWFKNKLMSVATVGNQSFTIWEQNPYLFKFKNFRPITGSVEYMYQNTTFIPLSSPSGKIDHVGVIVYDVTDIAVSKRELEMSNNKLEKLSRTDRLTKLYNRGFWEECLSNEFTRFKRTRQSTCVIMLDIDHFKKINDTHGHMAGDEVIRQTARTIRQCIRDTDIPGRYGGEEFVIISINTSPDDTLILAERLRKNIEALTVKYETIDINFTVSLGISEATMTMENHMKWLESADSGLYQSKKSGRNKSTIQRT